MRKIKKYIGTGEFYFRVFGIAIPIAMQSLITMGVNMVDNIMVGALGETALSAASLANQFIHIYQICCMGIGMGASVLVSRFWGMKDIVSLKKTITVMLRLCIVYGAIFTIATIVAPQQIMRMYTPQEQVIYEGSRYFFWSVPCYLLLGISLTCSIVLRSIGKARIPLVCSVISFSSNIFFNWLFIFGNLGAPCMGVAGAALGTLIARALEFSSIMFYFLFLEKKLAYRIKDLFMNCKELMPEYLRISIPVLISDALLALGNSAIAMIMGRIGTNFVSANSITTVTQQLTTVLTQGVSQAGCIITGHTLGEGKREQAQQEGYNFLFFGLGIGILASGIILLISKPVISMYQITEETRMIAEQLMKAVAFIVVFQSGNSILTKGVLRGGGDTKFLMVADIIFSWIVSIPLGMIAGLVLHLPAFWIYCFMKADQLIKCVWRIYRLRSGKWIKKINQKVVS